MPIKDIGLARMLTKSEAESDVATLLIIELLDD